MKHFLTAGRRNRRDRLFQRPFSKTASGFTLLEVVMGVALVSLLFGGIYGIANASIDLGKSVSDNRVKEMRVSGLVNFLKKGFEELPPGSQLALPDGEGTESVRVTDAPGLWMWSEATAGADAIEMVSEKAEEGVDLYLDHLRAVGGSLRPDESDFELISRSKLISLASFRWEFYDADGDDWVSEWPVNNGRPRLAAVAFSLPGDPAERRHVIAIAPEAEAPGEERGGDPNRDPAERGDAR